MSVRMRRTRAKTGSSRSHLARKIKEPRLIKCLNTQCEKLHLMHRACQDCGHYLGKKVDGLVNKITKKVMKKEARLDALKSKENQQEKEINNSNQVEENKK